MTNLVDFFTLPVTAYQVSERALKWISLEFGKLSPKHVAGKDMQLKEIFLGEFRVFVVGNWKIIYKHKVIVSRQEKNLDVLVRAPNILMGKILTGISVSKDLNKVTFNFSEGYKLIAENSLPKINRLKDYLFIESK